MTQLTLPELAKKMAGIDFTLLQTHAGGEIAGRPMSNNGDVDCDGDSWFFTTEDTDMVKEIEADPAVAWGFPAANRCWASRRCSCTCRAGLRWCATGPR